MATIIDLTAKLATLTMLRDRTPQTTRAERQGSSRNLAEYRDGAIFTTSFAGEGAWERHRNGEEIVHILNGDTTLHLMTEKESGNARTERGHDRNRAASGLAPVLVTRRRNLDDRNAAADRSPHRPCRGPADARNATGLGQSPPNNARVTERLIVATPLPAIIGRLEQGEQP